MKRIDRIKLDFTICQITPVDYGFLRNSENIESGNLFCIAE
jgi:hypothetical protein